jgi:ubiquinone/menaquinone biosynthesis C-methylase UbiE
VKLAMSLLAALVERVSDHPVLFIFFRSILENDFRAIRAIIRRELSLEPGLRTFDLGCGPGAFSDLFEQQDYVGADINRGYIEYARRHRKGAYVVADARNLELPNDRFDQVLIFGLLHHLPDEAVRDVLGEVKRVLVPGGHALIVEDIPVVSRLNLIGRVLHAIENGDHIRPVEAYRKLYEEAGTIEKDEVLRSGICDYYAAVLRT